MSSRRPEKREIPAFPNVVEDVGHNPARFLDRPIGPGADDAHLMLLEARIRGIDRISVLRAYEALERNPRVGRSEGPRERVIELLEERERELETIGERPDRLAFGPRRPPSMVDTESAFPDRDERSATDRLSSRRRAATDGGGDE